MSAFIKTEFQSGQNAWGGDNTSASAYGGEGDFGGVGSAYGVDSYGGFVHFKDVVPLVIVH